MSKKLNTKNVLKITLRKNEDNGVKLNSTVKIKMYCLIATQHIVILVVSKNSETPVLNNRNAKNNAKKVLK